MGGAGHRELHEASPTYSPQNRRLRRSDLLRPEPARTRASSTPTPRARTSSSPPRSSLLPQDPGLRRHLRRPRRRRPADPRRPAAAAAKAKPASRRPKPPDDPTPASLDLRRGGQRARRRRRPPEALRQRQGPAARAAACAKQHKRQRSEPSATGGRDDEAARISLAALLALAAAGARRPRRPGRIRPQQTSTSPSPAPKGNTLTQAGAHPFAMTTSFDVHGEATAEGGFLLDEAVKDLAVDPDGGLRRRRRPRCRACSTADFLTASKSVAATLPAAPTAPRWERSRSSSPTRNRPSAPSTPPSTTSSPPPGSPAGSASGSPSIPVTIDAGVRQAPPYRSSPARPTSPSWSKSSALDFTLWGVPADPAHDPLRGSCLEVTDGNSLGQLPSQRPRSCPSSPCPAPAQGPLPRATHRLLAAPGAWLPNGFPDLSDPSWVTAKSSATTKPATRRG